MINEKFELEHFMRGRNKDIHTEGHRPITHYRLGGYMDAKISQKARGGDNRTILQNKVSVMRRMRDNDKINVERPLG